MTGFAPAVQPGASLLLAFSAPAPSPPSRAFDTVLLLAPSRTNASRAHAALEAGYKVVVGSAASASWDPELATRRDQHQLTTVSWEVLPAATDVEWVAWFDQLPAEVTQRCMMIVLGDTTAALPSRRTKASVLAFAAAAHARRFLVNVADYPTFSDFSWPTTHRFDLGPDRAEDLPNARATAGVVNSTRSPLQIALTTNSSGCRLASRLKREMVSALPSNVGKAVAAVGQLRRDLTGQVEGDAVADETEGPLNRPVEQLTRDKSSQLEKWAAAMGGAGKSGDR